MTSVRGTASPSASATAAGQEPTAAERDSTAAARRWRYLGPMFGAVWLVFLIPPLVAGFDRRATLAGWLGIASTLAFMAVYLHSFAEARDRRTQQMTLTIPWPQAALRLGMLAVLGAAMCLTIGDSGLACTVYISVMAVVFLPTAVAAGLVVVVAVLAWAIPALVPGWTADSGLSLSVLISAFAMWGVKSLMLRNVDVLRAEQENARLAVEQERNRMARDLHDILGHSLTVITVKAELAGRLMDVDPARAKREVADLERLSRDALSDVRRAVEGYRELTLPGEIARARGALEAAQIHADLPGSVDIVPSDLREVFAWAVREGVTNVIRHSGATRCTILLAADRVEIFDDGTGCGGRAHTGGGSSAGNGLRGLGERASAVGAVLVTRALQPQGFSLALVASEPPDCV